MTAESGPVTASVARLEDLPSLAGQPLRGDWFAIEPRMLGMFATATYVDPNAKFSPDSAFPPGLVEGLHFLAVAEHRVVQMIGVDEAGVLAWLYGLERVRFISPVLAGDRMRLRGDVAEVHPKPGGHVVRLALEAELEGAEKPAFVADFLLYLTAEDSSPGGSGAESQ